MSIVGTREHLENFYSKYVDFRHVDIWFPPVDGPSEARYPVLYMHDGQNIFDHPAAFGGESWQVDQAMSRLIDDRKIRPAIVVGVWNSPIRWREYMPQRPYESPTLEKYRPSILERAGGPPISDLYLKFLVEELKPFVDARYPTLADRQNTFVMGSSMGGLISLYAISEYPQVFGGAGCVSTHWSAGKHALVDEMARILPNPSDHKLYFDFGTETLDSEYEPYQQRMDEHLQRAGYRENETGSRASSRERSTLSGRGVSGFIFPWNSY